MKIEGPRKSTSAKGAGKADGKKDAGDASFSGLIEDSGDAAAQKPVSGVMSINQLDALLSIQEAGHGTSEEGARRGRERAGQLLDQLDRLRIGLLAGEVPVAALQQMERLLKAHRDRIADPRLGELLDDIDLRVQVELAKLGR